jgi:phenylpropionate dioxygenase-like ring-hydroxylating dioxygenase large terminal subunit
MAKTTDPAALDDWYVVASETDIAEGKSYDTRLLGQPIHVARDDAGRAVCVEIGSGAVAHVAERYGFVWVCLGSPARRVVDIPEMAEPGRRFLQRGRIGVATSGPRIIENFFDLSHFSFVHLGTLGGKDSTEVPRYTVNFREDDSELWATECRFFQPKASAAAGGGSEVFYNYRVTSPFIAILYKDSLVAPGRLDLIGLFVQPREEDDCVVHSFCLVHDHSNSDTGLLHFYHEIFAQDRSVLIHQLPKRLPLMPRREIPTQSDAMSIAYRRWLIKSGLEFGVDRAVA